MLLVCLLMFHHAVVCLSATAKAATTRTKPTTRNSGALWKNPPPCEMPENTGQAIHIPQRMIASQAQCRTAGGTWCRLNSGRFTAMSPTNVCYCNGSHVMVSGDTCDFRRPPADRLPIVRPIGWDIPQDDLPPPFFYPTRSPDAAIAMPPSGFVPGSAVVDADIQPGQVGLEIETHFDSVDSGTARRNLEAFTSAVRSGASRVCCCVKKCREMDCERRWKYCTGIFCVVGGSACAVFALVNAFGSYHASYTVAFNQSLVAGMDLKSDFEEIANEHKDNFKVVIDGKEFLPDSTSVKKVIQPQETVQTDSENDISETWLIASVCIILVGGLIIVALVTTFVIWFRNGQNLGRKRRSMRPRSTSIVETRRRTFKGSSAI